jgi:hypothetical protein
MASTPGASNTVLDASVPYSASATRDLLGGLGNEPESFCSKETAGKLAKRAYCRAAELSAPGEPIIGLACTAALKTVRAHPRKAQTINQLCLKFLAVLVPIHRHFTEKFREVVEMSSGTSRVGDRRETFVQHLRQFFLAPLNVQEMYRLGAARSALQLEWTADSCVNTSYCTDLSKKRRTSYSYSMSACSRPVNLQCVLAKRSTNTSSGGGNLYLCNFIHCQLPLRSPRFQVHFVLLFLHSMCICCSGMEDIYHTTSDMELCSRMHYGMS